jgi:hypothetical protein
MDTSRNDAARMADTKWHLAKIILDDLLERLEL